MKFSVFFWLDSSNHQFVVSSYLSKILEENNLRSFERSELDRKYSFLASQFQSQPHWRKLAEMRTWPKMYGKSVQQRNVKQASRMNRHLASELI